jgi:hypothetical protein
MRWSSAVDKKRTRLYFGNMSGGYRLRRASR